VGVRRFCSADVCARLLELQSSVRNLLDKANTVKTL
jgi:hypothetical protein